MKHLSIKTRLTVWYTALMLVIVAVAGFAVWRLNKALSERDVQADLIAQVTRNAAFVHVQDKEPTEAELKDDHTGEEMSAHRLGGQYVLTSSSFVPYKGDVWTGLASYTSYSMDLTSSDGAGGGQVTWTVPDGQDRAQVTVANSDDPDSAPHTAYVRAMSTLFRGLASDNSDGGPWSDVFEQLADAATSVDLIEQRVITVSPSIDGVVHTAYVYGVPISSGETEVWLVGFIDITDLSNPADATIKAGLVGFPLLVLVGVLGGFLITRRSLRPLDEMAKTAEQIGSGRDLAQRIDIGEGSDEVHRLADTFNSMMDRLESQFAAEQQFSSDVSHELKTPVSVIKATTENALQFADGDASYRSALEVVDDQADKMTGIIGSLLALTRLEQGVEVLEIEQTDLSDFVVQLCGEFAPADARGMTLATGIDGGVSVGVDRHLMAQVVTNLLDNAYRYGTPGGVITVGLHTEDAAAVLTVADDGPGIAAEELPKIWQRFYQVDPARTSDDSASVGLGLALVRQVVELHGGTATAASVVGEGTTFTVRLPLA